MIIDELLELAAAWRLSERIKRGELVAVEAKQIEDWRRQIEANTAAITSAYNNGVLAAAVIVEQEHPTDSFGISARIRALIT